MLSRKINTTLNSQSRQSGCEFYSSKRTKNDKERSEALQQTASETTSSLERTAEGESCDLRCKNIESYVEEVKLKISPPENLLDYFFNFS
jgi:vacuolar-type H+-ATPase subunit H